MRTLKIGYIISFLLLSLSCGNNLKKALNTAINDDKKFGIERSCNLVEPFKIYTVKLFDSLQYCRMFDSLNILHADWYQINDKKIGPCTFYSINKKITRKVVYRNNSPIFVEDYFYSNSTGNLDSIMGSYFTRLKKGNIQATTVGYLRFKNGKIDKQRSNFYTINTHGNIIKSVNNSVSFKMQFYGSMHSNKVVFGQLDSSNINLHEEIDNVSTKEDFLILQKTEKNYIGLFIMQGNILFCNALNQEQDICNNKIPFYYPTYFMDPKLYEYLYGKN